MTSAEYLEMQKHQYEKEASHWSLYNKDPVVGSYDRHNSWSDYDQYLFKDFDTTNLVALEYGCGPARNLIKFNDRFARIDGVDIAEMNIIKARENLAHNSISGNNLYVCDGQSIPVDDNSYDVVFSVICLQHICTYDVRHAIMKDIKRVLKPGGYFCFQMGYGHKWDGWSTSKYYENVFDAKTTNCGYDISIENEEEVKNDLIDNLGFTNFKADLRPTGPGDTHRNWIWIQVQK